MDPEPWHIRLLNGIDARRGEQPLSKFPTRKSAALLAYLAYHLSHVHSRDMLADLLWPEAESSETARNRLKQELSVLRRLLEPTAADRGTVLLTDTTTVRLNPAMIRTDVAQIEAARQAAEETDDLEERAAHLKRAVDLCRGKLLPGFDEVWIGKAQERLAEIRFQILRRLAETLADIGRLQEAIGYAQRAVSADPLREEAYLDLMRLYAADGQTGAALREYRRLEQVLTEEFSEEPSPAALALAEEIRAGKHTPTRVRPPFPSQPATILLQETEEPPAVSETASPSTATVEPAPSSPPRKRHRLRRLWLVPVSALAGLWLYQANRPQPAHPVIVHLGQAQAVFTSKRAGNLDIWVMFFDGTSPQLLTRSEAPESDPALSPDGKRFAWLREENGTGDIFVANIDGGKVQQITHNPGMDRSPSWSRDGNRLVFMSNRNMYENIYIMNADGSGVRPLTQEKARESGPKWSPVEDRIVFCRIRNDGADLFLIDANGGNELRLTDGKGEYIEPAWSPDGRWIACIYRAGPGATKCELIVLDASTGQRVRSLYTRDHFIITSPSWSPDGQTLIFDGSNGNFDLFTIRADGTQSEPDRLTNSTGADAQPCFGPRPNAGKP